MVKTMFTYWISRLHSYTTGVTEAQLCLYECDSKNLTSIFVKSKLSLTEKLTDGTLVTPAPDPE